MDQKLGNKKGQKKPNHHYDSDKSDEDENEDSYWFSSIESEEEWDDTYDDDYYDEYGTERPLKKNARIRQKHQTKIVMYAWNTHYDVIKEVGKFIFEYHLTRRENCDWDLAWFDGPIAIRFLQKMHQYQRTNHFPGMYNLAKKNMLGRHLMRM